MLEADLGVKDVEVSLVAQEALADINGWRLTSVPSVLFEGKAKNGNLLARDGVEHGLYHALHKTLLLVVVDLDH